ncbi:MAG: T9SS type A sorting domain-containing protein, partial [Ginsengibacter sp.]
FASLTGVFFRNISDDVWTNLGNWQYSPDNTTWVASTQIPNSSATGITIMAGTNIIINSAVSIGGGEINGTLNLATGGIITLASNEDALTINDGGVLNITNTAAYTSTFVGPAGSLLTISSGGKISVGEGAGTGYESLAKSTPSFSSWETGSIFEWNNGLGVFGNLTYFPNSLAIPIFRITKIGGSAASITTINGILEVNTPVTLTATANTTLRNGIISINQSTLSQGTGSVSFQITADGAILNNIILNLNGGGLNIKNNTNSSGSVKIIGTKNVTIDVNMILTIDGNFDVTDRIISGAGGVTISSIGTYLTSLASGFSGAGSSITASGPLSLEDGSTVNYNGGSQTITNSIDYSNLILSGTGTKTAPAGVLNILGDYRRITPSIFAHNKGTVSFNGTNDQIINADGGETFFNLTNSNDGLNGLFINSTISIINELKVIEDPDYARTVLNSDIVIKSNSVGTGYISDLGNNKDAFTYNAGRFIIERYINVAAHKAWHFLSAPTIGNTFNSAWQEGNTQGFGAGHNVNPGYGTILTGTGATTGGYDTWSPQPSLKYFDNASNTYVEVKNTGNNMDFEGGYMVFVRGDRSLNPSETWNASSTTLRTKGKIYTPNQLPTPVSVVTNKWALIGNPYASSIDFTKILVDGGSDLSKISNTYYFWDANLTGTNGTGAFRTVSGGVTTPSLPPYTSTPIQSGEAFFVKNISTDVITITITEGAKVNGSSLQPFRTTSVVGKVSNDIADPDAQVRVNLYGFSGSTPVLIDGTVTLFSPEYSNELDALNAEKMSNINSENMGIRRNGKVFAIERKSMPENEDTIFYKMNNYKIAPYRFELIADKLDVSGQDAYLYDKFLNTFTPINPSGSTLYDFTIMSSPAGSWDENRFSIVFKTSSTTPVTLTNVKAYTQNKDIVVEWKVENESNLRSYTVETSSDGKTFTKGGTVAAKNLAATTYQWLDLNVASGYHYYRILSKELDGKTNYSKIVRVLVGNNASNAKITIYPNPIKDGVINLQFENQQAGVYQLRLLNTVGQVMMTKTITHSGGSSSELLMLNSTISKGIYQLEITKGSERVMSEKLVY